MGKNDIKPTIILNIKGKEVKRKTYFQTWLYHILWEKTTNTWNLLLRTYTVWFDISYSLIPIF